MSGMIVTWLRGLDEPALAKLLRLRPDALAPPAPSTLADLADRLSSVQSVGRAALALNGLELSVLEMVAGLDDANRHQLLALARPDSVADAAELELALARLMERGLCFETKEGGLRIGAAVGCLLPYPLGLGRPVASLLTELGQQWASRVRRTLGVHQAPSVRALADAIGQHLSPERVLQLVEAGGPEVDALLLDVLARGSRVGLSSGTTPALLPGPWRQASPLTWAVDRALLLPVGYGALELPREVGLALRGSDWHPQLEVSPPDVLTAPVDDEAVEREAQSALSGTVRLVTDVVDLLGRAPAAQLKTSGIGSREVRRIAKAVGQDEWSVRLALELADAATLLGAIGTSIAPSSRYDEWRALQPADRAAALLGVWWQHVGALTGAVDAVGKPCPPVTFHPRRPEAARLRRHLLEAACGLPTGRGAVGVEDLLPRLVWRAPLAHGEPDLLLPAAAAVWQEAQALGVVAHGRGTSLASALLRDDEQLVRARCGQLLPHAAAAVVFQSDLTALVAGAASPEVVELLDAVAVREVHGQAATWRLSPASVRRALDSGSTADELLDRLAGIASRELPQPLTYLVRDVARRHGHLGVAPVGCVVTSTDEPLLAEVAAGKSTRALSARLLAPTVLASGKPVRETLEVLRGAGYLPVQHDATGQVVLERPRRTRAQESRPPTATGALAELARQLRPPRRGDPEPAPSPEELAARLIGAPSSTPAGAPGAPRQRDRLAAAPTTVDEVAALAPRLSPDETRLLAHAVDHGGPVLIGYRDTNGTETSRVISECVLFPPLLTAWCHLRGDARTFAISAITGVAPA